LPLPLNASAAIGEISGGKDIIRRNPSQEKEWLADLLGEAAAKNIDWASPSAKASRRAKAETKNI
jgi:hypothetical protein